ncbi:DUF6461 domain-containing protein [Actinophytocola gossypii]|uniref:Uncharacterized protein n=1 Tax=Actinophytocola gossypii TaxID=2812003 RepID=A0ABT2J2I7_9PSEU|nr:DUF6461 domain-containing protein [Actinophytocola gossypii]MCT2581710.1 hypothetical protein [Actinophytocola gossypii]
MPAELVDKYAWAADVALEAWTVAVVQGRSVEDVLLVYGADPAAPVGGLTFAGVDELRGPQVDQLDLYVQVKSGAGHVVAIENNGWSGSLPEIARRCSASGHRFFSVYWNANGFGMVTQAIDGEVTAGFEMNEPTLPGPADEWERRPSWAVGPETDVELVRQTCLAMLEQQTGVEIDPGWLSEPLPTYRVPEPYWLYRDLPGADRV